MNQTQTDMLIHHSETLGVGSVEAFLSPADIAELTSAMDEFLTGRDLAAFGDQRTGTIHEIPGLGAADAMQIYEPHGRIEIPEIPEPAQQILRAAFLRARDAIAQIMPSITDCRPWTYVEYGPGQHITAHLDGIAPDPLAWPRQIAGISVVISPATSGGGFFVETTASQQLWQTRCDDPASGYHPGAWLAHDGADHSAEWFRTMARTRWTAQPTPGTALLYGSQVAHGTEPVEHGSCRKFISWLIADR